jgi:hypothetical protein
MAKNRWLAACLSLPDAARRQVNPQDDPGSFLPKRCHEESDHADAGFRGWHLPADAVTPSTLAGAGADARHWE